MGTIESRLDRTLHAFFDAWELMYYTGSRGTAKKRLRDFDTLEIFVIRKIEEGGGCVPLAQIRRGLELSNSTLTGLIQRLEKNGVLARFRDPSDRRAFNLVLTGFGREIDRQHRAVDRNIVDNFLSRVTREEAEEFVRIASKALQGPLVSEQYSARQSRK